MDGRLNALVTGVSRRAGIAAAVARALAAEGWDLSLTGWRPYDETMPWGRTDSDIDDLVDELAALGARADFVDADLERPDAPAEILKTAVSTLGPITALVVVHTHDTGGGLLDMTAADFDRHMAVNARSTLLLAAEFTRQFTGQFGTGRIVTFTSGLPLKGSIAYAASKGAVEWITGSAAAELTEVGITVNAVNPGPNDTGWMSPAVRDHISNTSPAGRAGRPEDAAHLVAFLCSEKGGWVSGQVINSDGGWSTLRT
ncbi:MAG: SDR family oxidoreductase [Acidimicrobiia bacterium]